MIRRRFRFVVPAVLVLSLAGASLALAGSQGGGPKFKFKHNGGSGALHADLSGRQEAPAIHTAGRGHLTLTMTNSTTFSYELSYSGLSGSATAAHIHFAQPNVNGAVVVDLCAGTKPACPAGNSGTVTGTFTATDVKPVQGLSPTDFAGFLEELRDGFMYANIHTAAFGSGEIRGQIGARHFGKAFGRWWKDPDDD